MRSAPSRSLRGILTASLAVLVTLAVIAATALIVLTTMIHRVTRGMADSVQSVRIAEQLEIDLLTHERAGDRLIKTSIAADLRRHLGQVGQYIGSDAEAAILERARAHVESYLAPRTSQGASDSTSHLEDAFAALEELVDLNIAQAMSAHERVARFDRIANVLGLGVAIALLAGVGISIGWLRRAAFGPLIGIGEAMHRFSHGERGARALERGPTELRLMAQQFNEMADRLARERERQLAFLAGVSHDLRNPLSALKVSASCLPPQGPLPNDHVVRRTFSIVSRQVDRLERMVSDLLDAASIEGGHLELRPVECDLRRIVVEAADLFRPTTDRHEFHVDVGDTPVIVRADELRLEQVATNLLSNAIKYSPAGGQLALSVAIDGASAVLCVSDEGMGIAPEELSEIFEPFHRAGSSRDVVPGVGLGLSVTRQIVEAHGGSIEVESQPGIGTTFRVRIPLAGIGPSPRRAGPSPALH